MSWLIPNDRMPDLIDLGAAQAWEEVTPQRFFEKVAGRFQKMFSKVLEHFHKAIDKHEDFPDVMTEATLRDIRVSLGHFREINDNPKTTKTAYGILMEEVLEMEEAFLKGEHEQAKEEAYDAIAVLLRIVALIDINQYGRYIKL